MRKLIGLLMVAVFAAAPAMMIAGCEENEVKVERREKIEHRSEPTPTVVPDAPQQ